MGNSLHASGMTHAHRRRGGFTLIELLVDYVGTQYFSRVGKPEGKALEPFRLAADVAPVSWWDRTARQASVVGGHHAL